MSYFFKEADAFLQAWVLADTNSIWCLDVDVIDHCLAYWRLVAVTVRPIV